MKEFEDRVEIGTFLLLHNPGFLLFEKHFKRDPISKKRQRLDKKVVRQAPEKFPLTTRAANIESIDQSYS